MDVGFGQVQPMDTESCTALLPQACARATHAVLLGGGENPLLAMFSLSFAFSLRPGFSFTPMSFTLVWLQ